MDTEIIKLIHAISGFIIAFAGFLQIVLKKGGPAHRIIGLIYYYTWYLVIITGAFIGSPLITLIGILGWYMSFTGYRFGHRKNSILGIFDKIVIVLGVLFALGTFGGGLYYLSQSYVVAGTIGTFFGLIFLLLTQQDFREFILLKPVRSLSKHALQWYFEHFTRMLVSYIAAMTAFAVINEIFWFALMDWILPTIIGTTIIILLSRRYMKKFNIRIDPKRMRNKEPH